MQDPIGLCPKIKNRMNFLFKRLSYKCAYDWTKNKGGGGGIDTLPDV